MVHTIEIIRVKDEFHIMNNGGLAFRFDATIFDQAQIMQFAKKEFEILEKILRSVFDQPMKSSQLLSVNVIFFIHYVVTFYQPFSETPRE